MPLFPVWYCVSHSMSGVRVSGAGGNSLSLSCTFARKCKSSSDMYPVQLSSELLVCIQAPLSDPTRGLCKVDNQTCYNHRDYWRHGIWCSLIVDLGHSLAGVGCRLLHTVYYQHNTGRLSSSSLSCLACLDHATPPTFLVFSNIASHANDGPVK